MFLKMELVGEGIEKSLMVADGGIYSGSEGDGLWWLVRE